MDSEKTDTIGKIRFWRLAFYGSIAGIISTLASLYFVYRSQLRAIEKELGSEGDEIMIYLHQRDVLFSIPLWVILLLIFFVITFSLARRRLKKLRK